MHRHGVSGRSEGIRTPDILLPKQARYQLRYTPAGLSACDSLYIIAYFFENVNLCFLSVSIFLKKRTNKHIKYEPIKMTDMEIYHFPPRLKV